MKTAQAIVCLVAAFSFTLSAADQVSPKPTLGEKGKVLFSDTFERTELGAEWAAAKGSWAVADGVLKGVEKAEDSHAAVLKHKIELKDFIAQFSFRFDGGKTTAFSLNGKGGHICRVMITPTGYSLKKDKPNKNSTEAGATLGTSKIEFKPGQWYTMLVEISGKKISAQVSGTDPVCGEHDGIDVPKLDVALPVGGEGVSFDNLTIWELTPKASAQ